MTGARPRSGNNVSHSQRKTKRRFLPNLIKKTVLDEQTGLPVTLKITARALRTMTKNPRKFAPQITAIAKKQIRREQKLLDSGRI